ncbi:hypothetical protein pb186bvf_016365 [Paramecium bursaria]
MIILLLIGLVASSPLTKELIELSLNNGPKDQVIQALTDLLQDLRKDQSMDDAQQSKILAKIEADLAVLHVQLEVQQNQQRTTNQLLGDLSEEIYTISRTSANLQTQLTQTNQREESLIQFLADEESNFNKKQEQTRKSVDALNEIIQKLTGAVLNASFIEKGEFVQKIKQQLGDRNPIAMLVEVTAKFDEKVVKNIILKLEHIVEEQEQEFIQNEAHWEETQQTTNTLLQQTIDVRKRLSFDFGSTQAALNKKSNEKVLAEKRKSDLEVQIPQTEQIIQNTQLQLSVYESAYEQRKKSRSDEIGVLDHALQLVAKK